MLDGLKSQFISQKKLKFETPPSKIKEESQIISDEKGTKHNRSEVIEKCVDIYFKNEKIIRIKKS